MAQQKMLMEAIIDLDRPLLFGPDFLGSAERANIGGIDVQVQLPDFEKPSDDFRPTWPNRIKIDWNKYLGQQSRLDMDALGKVLQSKQNQGREGIGRFAVAKLMVASVDEVDENQAQELLHSAEDWQRRLVQWVEVVSRYDVFGNNSEVIQHDSGVIAYFADGSKK